MLNPFVILLPTIAYIIPHLCFALIRIKPYFLESDVSSRPYFCRIQKGTYTHMLVIVMMEVEANKTTYCGIKGDMDGKHILQSRKLKWTFRAQSWDQNKDQLYFYILPFTKRIVQCFLLKTLSITLFSSKKYKFQC